MLNNIDVANTEVDYTDNAFMALVHLRGFIIKTGADINEGQESYTGFVEKTARAVKDYKERFLMSDGRLMNFDSFTSQLVQLVDNYDPLKPTDFLEDSYKMILKIMPTALSN